MSHRGSVSRFRQNATVTRSVAVPSTEAAVVDCRRRECRLGLAPTRSTPGRPRYVPTFRKRCGCGSGLRLSVSWRCARCSTFRAMWLWHKAVGRHPAGGRAGLAPRRWPVLFQRGRTQTRPRHAGARREAGESPAGGRPLRPAHSMPRRRRGRKFCRSGRTCPRAAIRRPRGTDPPHDALSDRPRWRAPGSPGQTPMASSPSSMACARGRRGFRGRQPRLDGSPAVARSERVMIHVMRPDAR